jgi:hypothetical protein
MANFSRVTVPVCLIACLSASLPARADGALDFADYCKGIQKEHKSVVSAIERDVGNTTAKLAAWYKDPTTIPEADLEHYRNIVQIASYKEWEQSASGVELIKAWQKDDPKVDLVKAFNAKIYSKEMTKEKETTLAQKFYQIDYEQNIKPKIDADVATINKNISESKQKISENCKPDVVSQIFRGTIGRVLLTYEGNKQASKDEKGDLARLTRQFTGVSLTDIMKYGIGGGPNSEAKKLGKTWTDGLDSVGIGPNSVLRQTAAALDPTNVKLPSQVKVTINKNSLPNLEKNLNPARWSW